MRVLHYQDLHYNAPLFIHVISNNQCQTKGIFFHPSIYQIAQSIGCAGVIIYRVQAVCSFIIDQTKRVKKALTVLTAQSFSSLQQGT